MTTQHFLERRTILLRTFGPTISEVETTWSLANTIPVCTVDATVVMARLKTGGFITANGRWCWYPKDPENLAKKEDAAYKLIEKISEAVLKEGESQEVPRACTRGQHSR